MKRRLILICLVILPQLLAACSIGTRGTTPRSEKPLDFFSNDQIGMDVSFDHTFSSYETRKKSETDVWIYCRWTNKGKANAQLLLKDHNDYHGTLDYPCGLAVRVTDKSGKVITTNSTIEDGWWNSFVVRSDMLKLMPGDVITLKPGDRVVRRVSLASILDGLDLGESISRQPLDGDYSVELRLDQIIATTALALHVGEAAKPAPQTK